MIGDMPIKQFIAVLRAQTMDGTGRAELCRHAADEIERLDADAASEKAEKESLRLEVERLHKKLEIQEELVCEAYDFVEGEGYVIKLGIG